MDRPRGYYAKGNKSDRKRQILHVIPWVWNLKYKTNKHNKIEIVIDTENKEWFPGGREGG